MSPFLNKSPFVNLVAAFAVAGTASGGLGISQRATAAEQQAAQSCHVGVRVPATQTMSEQIYAIDLRSPYLPDMKKSPDCGAWVGENWPGAEHFFFMAEPGAAARKQAKDHFSRGEIMVRNAPAASR